MKNGKWFCLIDRVSGRDVQAFSTLSQSCAIVATTARQLAARVQLFGSGDAVKAMLKAMLLDKGKRCRAEETPGPRC
jgi:hypothetical protein